LTTRGSKNPEPLRVVFTKSLDLPSKSNLWDCSKAKTLVIYDCSTANESYLSRIPKCVEVEKVLSDNRTVLDEMAQMLIERETIDTEDIQDLLNRSEVKVANYI